MTRRVKEKLDPRLDETLLRHVRLVKPHLALPGFKIDKWATVAAAVNRDMDEKVWGSGHGAQGRYSHLVQMFHKNHSDMTPLVRERFKDYLKLLKKRGPASARRRNNGSANDDAEQADEEQDEEEEEAKQDKEGDGDAYEHDAATEDDEDEIQEVRFTRDQRASEGSDAMALSDLVRPPQAAALANANAVGPPGAAVTSVALFHDTVTALREMTGGLLHVIEQDHAARRDEAQRNHQEAERNRQDRKELLEVVRLALQPRE